MKREPVLVVSALVLIAILGWYFTHGTSEKTEDAGERVAKKTEPRPRAAEQPSESEAVEAEEEEDEEESEARPDGDRQRASEAKPEEPAPSGDPEKRSSPGQKNSVTSKPGETKLSPEEELAERARLAAGTDINLVGLVLRPAPLAEPKRVQLAGSCSELPPVKVELSVKDGTTKVRESWDTSRTIELFEAEVLGGRLAGAVVALSGAELAKAAPAVEEAPFEIGIEACRFVPPIAAVREGRAIHFVNLDSFVNFVEGGGAKKINRVVKVGERLALSSGKAGIEHVYRHSRTPDFTASISVFDHPFFAVSGVDGSFAMSRVPPGTYRLFARHPTLGSKEVEVVVLPGVVATALFVF